MDNIKYILSGISFLIVGFFFLRFTINSLEIIKHRRRIILKVCSIFLFIIGLGMIVCSFVLNEYKWNKIHDDWYYCLDKRKQVNIVILDDDMLKVSVNSSLNYSTHSPRILKGVISMFHGRSFCQSFSDSA